MIKSVKDIKNNDIDIKLYIRKNFKTILLNFFRAFLIIGLSFIILYPIMQQISTAFKSPADLGSPNVIWIPLTPSTEHIRVALKVLNYSQTLPYTLFSSALLMVLQTASAALAGYAFARLRFKGSNILFFFVILTIIIPPQTIMLSQYLHFKQFDILGIFNLINGSPLNLLNSPTSLILMSMTGVGLKAGLYIFIFRQFFRGIPKELEEAALIDGAGVVRTFFSIMLPNAKPAFITVTIFSFVWNWSDTYYTALFNPSNSYLAMRLGNAGQNMKSAIEGALGVQLSTYMPNPAYESAVTSTAGLFVVIPLILLYLVVQKQFVEGVERSGIVG